MNLFQRSVGLTPSEQAIQTVQLIAESVPHTQERSVSDERQKLDTPEAMDPVSTSALQAAPSPTEAAPAESLDSVDDIDFLLEEIENKIAPLALA